MSWPLKLHLSLFLLYVYIRTSISNVRIHVYSSNGLDHFKAVLKCLACSEGLF